MKFLESTSNNPYYNLALEEYMFNNLPPEESLLMFWQNDNAIIIGKFQNTAEEINSSYVEEHNIRVARRLSGGGAVYHDLGNLNYTIITAASEMEKLNLHAFSSPLKNALNEIGIVAEISGRNDVLIDGKKFCGQSQYLKNGKVMHHGAILFNSDLSVLSNALKVSADKIESKGHKSVRSRVTNITDYLDNNVDLEKFKEIFKLNISKNEAFEEINLSSDQLSCIEKLMTEKYSTWDWNYGHNPDFKIKKTRRIPDVGQIAIQMNVSKNVIDDIAINGDFFGSMDISNLCERLSGTPLKEVELKKKLYEFPMESYINNLSLDSFIDLLLK